MKRLGKNLLFMLLLLAALGLAACGGDEPQTNGRPEVTPDLLSYEPQSSVTVYFPAADSDVLVPLSYGINSSRDTIWIALEKLLAGPTDTFCRQALPLGVKLEDLYYADGVVHISLKGDAPLSLDDVNLDAFYATVNDELLEQDDTTAAILISYNDQTLLSEPYAFQYLNDYSDGQGGSYVYYTDSQAMYLVPLTLPINRADYVDDADDADGLFAYLEALIAAWAAPPPEESGLYAAVPAGMTAKAGLLSLHTEENGAFTVDFSADLLNIGGSSQERLLVDSLLATLINVDEVNRLYFRVDGETVDMLPHGTDLSGGLPVEHDDFNFNSVGNPAGQ